MFMKKTNIIITFTTFFLLFMLLLMPFKAKAADTTWSSKTLTSNTTIDNTL